jgi:hypothetical protein
MKLLEELLNEYGFRQPPVYMATVFDAALRLLEGDQERWIKRHLACDENHSPVCLGDPTACRFCTSGALLLFTDWHRCTELTDYAMDVGFPKVVSFNDTHTYEDVLAMLRYLRNAAMGENIKFRCPPQGVNIEIQTNKNGPED